MPGLDAEELLHLGLHALRNNDPHEAIKSLKQCLDLNPTDAKATYLLGATYAQVAMYDRAKQLLQQAVLLNPQEYTAVFQLGLLHLTSGDVETSRQVWEGLDELGAEHYLHLFKSAMLALVVDDFARCIELIEAGVRANSANDALNGDMLKVKESAAEAMANNAGAAPAGEGTAAANHFALSGYQQMTDKK
jgi:tetratricopeptide (TPR) repeat protein